MHVDMLGYYNFVIYYCVTCYGNIILNYHVADTWTFHFITGKTHIQQERQRNQVRIKILILTAVLRNETMLTTVYILV